MKSYIKRMNMKIKAVQSRIVLHVGVHVHGQAQDECMQEVIKTADPGY